MHKRILILIGIYLYVFGVLLNHNHAWMNQETAVITADILSEPTTAKRLSRALDWYTIENLSSYGNVASRARILSHVVFTTNIVVRNFLFHFIPPHPSLSITWIFALFITPFFLYKLGKLLFKNDTVAFLTAALYLCLPGTLIPIIMNHRPDKSLSNFWYVLCLYLAAKLLTSPDQINKKIFIKKFVLLTALIATSFLFDEYCLFIFFLIPVILPELMAAAYKRSPFLIVGYLSLPLYYLLMIKFFLPIFYTVVGYPGFDFTAYIKPGGGFGFSFFNACINFFLLLHENLLAGLTAYLRDPSKSVYVSSFDSLSNQLINGDNIFLGLSFLHDKHLSALKVSHNTTTLIFVAAAVFLWIRSTASLKDLVTRLVTRLTIAMIGYTLFFSILHVKSNILSGCGWYGCNFSVLFSLFIGGALLLFINTKSRAPAFICLVFFVSLIASSLNNTKYLNQAWKAMSYEKGYWQLDLWLNKTTKEELYQKHFRQRERNNFKIAHEAWQNTRTPWKVRKILETAPEDLRIYLSVELSYIK